MKHGAWALLTLALAAQASAGTLLQNGVTVSNLQMTLNDLTPGDATHASIQWMTSETSSPYTSFFAGTLFVNGVNPSTTTGVLGGLLDATEDGAAALPNAEVSKTGLNQHAGVSMTTADATTALQQSQGIPLNEEYMHDFSSMAAVSPSQSYYTGNTFVLAAHSQVTFSGKLSFDKTLNVQELAQTTALTDTLSAGKQVFLNSEAGLYLSLTDPTVDSPTFADSYRYVTFLQSLNGHFELDGR